MVVVLATGFDVVATYRRIDRTDIAVPAVSDGATTWLLIGSDSRAEATDMPGSQAFGSADDVPGARADVMVLVQPAHDGEPARMVSIPRDLLVFRVGHGADRLALTYLDSPASTVRSICRSLGVAVDHVAIVEFGDVRRLVDDVGGIEVNVALRTRDLHTGLDLPSGTSNLDGAAAIAWVRSRHPERWTVGKWVADEGGDRVRQESQRALLGAVAAKIAQQARNPWRARQLARSIGDEVTIDGAAGPLDLMRLARVLEGHPRSESVPNRYVPGPIPVAELSPEAQGLLDGLRKGAPSTAACPRARPQPG